MFDYEGFRAALRSLVTTIYGPITSGEWVGWEAGEQQKLNTAVHAVNKVYNVKLRPAYDQALYDGTDNGKVRAGLEPVRKRTVKDDADKPKEPTAEEWLAELAPDIETPETEQVTLDLV